MRIPSAITLSLVLGGTAFAGKPPVVLQTFSATSGAGVERVLDGDPATGWRPEGAAQDEGVLLRLEEPASFDTVAVQPCTGAPRFLAGVSLDGIVSRSLYLEEGKATFFAFGDRKTRSVFVKLENAPDTGEACVGEIRLVSKESTLAVKPPRSVPGRIQASSVLAPAEAYHAGFLFDGRTDFGWAEGAKGTGAGESVTLTLEAPIELVALELWNGYQRSDDHFHKNARAEQLSLSVDGGAPMVLQVKDGSGSQRLTLPAPVKGRTFKLTVDTPVSGSKYPDLVLSELRLVDAQGPLTVRTSQVETYQKALQAQVKGTNLEHVVDRSWKKLCDPREKEVFRTFKVRSNHTFVFYDSATDLSTGKVDYKEVLDGAWVVKKAGSPWATLELYGRRHRVEEEVWEPYGELAREKTEHTRVGGGKLEIARVADLGEKAFQKLVAEWSKGPQRQVVSCVGEQNPYESLAAGGAILVRGTAVTELFTQ